MRALYWTIAIILQPLSLAIMLISCSGDWIGGDSGFREVAARVQINAYMTALEAYRQDVGDYPSANQGLQALRVNPGVAGWYGPYLQKDLGPDPWGKAYRYSRNGVLPEIVSPGLPAPAPIKSPFVYLQTVIFLASAIVFFGYPFLPALLRRVHSIH